MTKQLDDARNVTDEPAVGANDEALRMDAFSRLAGSIAHDFNNFLTSVLATTDLALATPLPPELKADLESMREAGKRAAATTRQLLMFSRKQITQPRPTDLNELLAHVEPVLRRFLPASIALDVRRTATGSVEVDPAQIEQVIVDLARNAADAMPRGGKLAITTTNLETHQVSQSHGRTMLPGKFAVLRVEDTGVGMDEATQQRIFEPYFTTKKETGNAGLGLASVYGAVVGAGGHVFVRSRPGEGSVVEVCLPLSEAAASTTSVSVTQGIVVGGGEVILVIEPEPSVRAPICRSLRLLGYFVLESKTPDDALQVLQDYHAPVHLVVADVSAPDVNANELVDLLRSLFPQLKVLVLTAQEGQPETNMQPLPSGSRVLQKPFSGKRLTMMVRSLLDEGRRSSGMVSLPAQ